VAVASVTRLLMFALTLPSHPVSGLGGFFNALRKDLNIMGTILIMLAIILILLVAFYLWATKDEKPEPKPPRTEAEAQEEIARRIREGNG
jgi:hypothetical protein